MQSPSVTVAYPSTWNIAEWANAHSRGERPSGWPYGLDQLRTSLPESGVGLTSVGRAMPVGLATALGRRLGLGGPGGRADVGVAWEETTGTRMLRSGAAAANYCGVIWASDPPVGALDRIRRTLVHPALVSMQGLWCLSEPQVHLVKKMLGRRSPPVSYVRFGIDTDFFALQPFPEAPLVVSAGGDRDRDTATLYRALQRVHSVRPEARLVVQSKSELEPPPGVEVVPHMSHEKLRDLYGLASVVVVATKDNSHVSGMTVALEAQATGRPVVITGSPGMEDYVANGSTGTVVDRYDDRALAEGVIAMLESPGDSARIGLQGRQSVVSRHTTSHLVRDIQRVIGL
jgi:glycosyltransferase involved in cell wall biosynthesis